MDRHMHLRLRDQSLNRLIPNMLTILALGAGLTSIKFGFAGQWEKAVFAIVVAGILDGLDGRIARMLNGASKFGAELDSLSDFISFGVAPAMLMYYWALKELGGFGWVLVIFFSVCCALRLARFNTRIENTDLPAWTGRFFSGAPAPAGAGLVIVPLIATLQFGSGFFDRPFLVGAVVFAVALLMVSTVPTYSLKRLRVPHHYVLPTLLSVGFMAALLVSEPWITLLAVGVVYAASIPIGILAYRKLARQRPIEPAERTDTPDKTTVV